MTRTNYYTYEFEEKQIKTLIFAEEQTENPRFSRLSNLHD